MRHWLCSALFALVLGFSQALELHFIDVGQGDAVLIRDSAGRNVLYDGGRSATGALDYLRMVGVESLDLVIASHPDADHIGGLVAVIDSYQPRFYIDNGLPHTTQTYRRLLEAVAGAGSQYLEPTARRIGMGELTLRVLPPPGDPSLGQNDNSVGLLIEHGKFRAALTGDATGRQFEWWARTVPELMQAVTIYKASHHGSSNGDTRWSVDSFRPQAVVISVGGGNGYGHPAEETTLLYHSVSAQIYRTDLNGTVRVEAAADGSYRIHAARGNELPLTHLLALAPGSRDEQEPGDGVPDPEGPEERVADAQAPGNSGPAGQGDGPFGSVIIECILFDPVGRDHGNEVVTLATSRQVDVSGWILVDEARHRFSLPPRTLSAGEQLQLPNRGRPVWNNTGDTAYLYDAQGGLIDSFSYSGSGSRACR